MHQKSGCFLMFSDTIEKKGGMKEIINFFENSNQWKVNSKNLWVILNKQKLVYLINIKQTLKSNYRKKIIKCHILNDYGESDFFCNQILSTCHMQ